MDTPGLLLSWFLLTISLLSNCPPSILPDKSMRSAEWILLSARVFASILVTDIKEDIMRYRHRKTQARNSLNLQSHNIPSVKIVFLCILHIAFWFSD
jgi:hypothetical protein